MSESNAKPRRVISIVGPLVSFVVLAVVVVSAVAVGNLRERLANDCWPTDRRSGVGDEGQSWPVLVWSKGDNELMLCDVGTETVKFEPPEGNASSVLVGKSMVRLHTGEEIVLPDSLFGKGEGSELIRGDRGVLLYEKGVFGEVEDCYGDPYVSGEPEQIWPKDLFGLVSDLDDIQSCWFKLEFEYVAE